MLKVGIVGMGGMGWFHARRYRELRGARITAIADLVPERLEGKKAVQVNLAEGDTTFDLAEATRYGEGLDLIKKADVDVVDICLPTYLHASYVIEALKAGHHVLCEKPMALGVEEADRMIAAADETDRLLMIAQVIRFWPEYRFLQARIEDGTYGALQSLNMWRMSGRPGWSPDNWFLDPALSGGAILDLHIHDLDYANAVFGRPDHVYATGRISAVAKTYDVIHACLTYQDGPQVHMHAGWASGQVPFEAGYEAWFDHAFVRYDAGKLEVFPDPDKAIPETPDYESGDGYLAEIGYFLECVESGRRPERCTPRSTRDSLALVQQELQAIHALTPEHQGGTAE
ncbi:MAG: Gfo/Idh/MocA family protein [Anaerolineae bacterium]